MNLGVETWERIAALSRRCSTTRCRCVGRLRRNQHIIQSGSLVISQNTMAPMASMAAGPMTT